MQVLSALKKVATEQNLTILAVLHQPRYEIFSSFDELLILGRGKMPNYASRGGSTNPSCSYHGAYTVCQHYVVMWHVHSILLSVVDALHVSWHTGGYTAFMGATGDAVPYFQSLGFQLANNVNPADFLMDAVRACNILCVRVHAMISVWGYTLSFTCVSACNVLRVLACSCTCV